MNWIESEYSVRCIPVNCLELDETDMNPFELTTVQSVINMVSKYCGGDENE